MGRQKRRFEYPFAKKWVYVSVGMAVGAIAMALSVLTKPLWLLSYFIFTFLMTATMFAGKLYLYSSRTSENLEGRSFDNGERYRKHGSKWVIITLLGLTIVALFLPAFLSMVLEPVAWYVGLSGFVAGVSLSEVALYLYSR